MHLHLSLQLLQIMNIHFYLLLRPQLLFQLGIFFQAEDGIRDFSVTGVLTCALPILSTDNKGLTVRPEGCEMDFQIKKSAIAINAADARPSRWTGGEKLDCAIADLDLGKRKEIGRASCRERV